MRRPNSPPLEPWDQESVVALYEAGTDRQQLARMFDTTIYRIDQCLKAHRVAIRPRAEVTRCRNEANAQPIDPRYLRLLVETGLSVPAMAAWLGVSEPTVAMRLRKLGLRSQHGRGSPMEANYFWKGGRTIDGDGYVMVKSPGHPFADHKGYVREHRLVMEEQLGRYLDPREVVHHKNRDKQDNRPDNLQVYRTNGEHLKDELTGKTPNYTPEGLRRMRENALAVNRRRAEASQQALETGAVLSPLPGDQSPE